MCAAVATCICYNDTLVMSIIVTRYNTNHTHGGYFLLLAQFNTFFWKSMKFASVKHIIEVVTRTIISDDPSWLLYTTWRPECQF